MTRRGPILLIEDTPSLQMVYEAVLTKAGFEVRTAATAAEGRAACDALRPAVVLVDLVLPDRDGLELMTECLAEDPDARFVVITAHGSIDRAVAAMRAGAHDFLVKPFDETRLVGAVRNALSAAPAAPRAEPPAEGRFAGFVGASPEMREVYARIESIGRSMATVFITGESGTGKALCARAIHQVSTRVAGPFVPLDCAAVPADLLEAELFGRRGAEEGRGAAAAADGGTLFLDEVCELDLNLQARLLGFLQGAAPPGGGAAPAARVDARVICATSRDPLEEVRRGRFRADLYSRLHVVPIHLPPLRARGNDAAEIADAAIPRLAAEQGRRFRGLSDEVKALFPRLPWPGNVRQLLEVLRDVVRLNDGDLVRKEMLPIEILHLGETAEAAAPEPGVHGTEAALGAGPPGAGGAAGAPLGGLIGRTLAEIEQIVIEETIARCGGSVPRAARMLDVSPSTLYRKRETWRR
jgi:DNA-binding NtrC family response regulator